MSADPRKEIAKRSRRAFLWMGVIGASCFGALRWLVNSKKQDGLDPPLRAAHEFNERLWRRLFGRERRVPEFPAALSKMPRQNGRYGLRSELDLASYRLTIELSNFRKEFSLEDIKASGEVEQVTELCCIEGWSQIVKWTGIPLAELLEKKFGVEWLVQSEGNLYEYAYAETPDGQYYVALDLEAALHPQTLVCWAMDGRPLEPDHGAPLRLVVPTKYGIKSLKRLGTIRLSNVRPLDYWHERGYDWYAGL